MAQIYKFFNSGVGDPRKYQASDFADFFGDILSTGLLNTDVSPGMSVSVETGTLNCVVSAGKALMRGYPYANTTPLTLTHKIPEATLDRIDRIVLRLDLRNAERNILLHVKEGDPSATPVAPTLQRDNFIHEISLAQIRVRKNTVQLLPADLIDERLNENVCGLVTWTPQVPTEQFQRQWDEFMAGIEDEGFATVDSVKAVDRKVDEHKADDTSHVKYGLASGTNAKTIALNPAPVSLTEGMGLSFKNVTQNTGAVTLNVNGLGAKSVLKSNGATLASGNLKKDSVYTVRYNGTAFILQGEGGSGNAQPTDVVAGKTFTNDNGEQVGAGDANLTPVNIKKDVIVFGVKGTLVEIPPFVAGDGQRIYNDGSGFVTKATTFTKAKEVRISRGGTFRVSFSLSVSDPGILVEGRVYKNGAAVGITRSTNDSTSYVTFTEDITFGDNELAQIYIRSTSSTTNAWLGTFAINIALIGPTITKIL